ncbi:hypothetical protein [Paenibacillus protaetiae]|uniref:Uncharacterized protein n=1 Tax=Paenibacillus protaetiae TaxID=2509456 RepID=A0A4P6ES97_9BACL|nr:hypothetical protein [Paenibacillus protaetiae]QAY65764.1 hypothetical protein ET464_04590 [Paenibacillus protaetiae]
MSQRYRITRQFQEPAGEISLEECHAYFEARTGFTYTSVFTVKNESSTMSIEGHFFMWDSGSALIPFRYYAGDVYVSGTNEAVIPVMLEAASALRADVAEG